MKTMKRYLIAATSFWVVVAVAHAVEIRGTVTNATEEYATVTTDSDLFPVPGDKAEIFFKMPGKEVEIAVASGHVYEITGDNIMVKIDNATGTVNKNQLVRIDSPNPLKRSKAEKASSGQSSGQSTKVTISFDDLTPGPISNDAFADRGVRLTSNERRTRHLFRRSEHGDASIPSERPPSRGRASYIIHDYFPKSGQAIRTYPNGRGRRHVAPDLDDDSI